MNISQLLTGFAFSIIGLANPVLAAAPNDKDTNATQLCDTALTEKCDPSCNPPPGYTVVRNATDLRNIQLDMRGRYFLCNDIKLRGEFTPLEVDYAEKLTGFSGVLDGNNHTISGLRINRPGEDRIGLFRRISHEGVVRNLRIVGSTIIGRDYVGVVAGEAYGRMENISISGLGSVSGKRFVGGLVGDVISGNGATTLSNVTIGDEITIFGELATGGLAGHSLMRISNASSAADVVCGRSTPGHSSVYCGGLVGVCEFRPILNSNASGNVSGERSIGGLVGVGNCTISNSHATGAVSGEIGVGGLVGFHIAIAAADIQQSYATGDVTAQTFIAGGLVGGLSDIAIISDSYATGNVVSAHALGGLVGQTSSGSSSNCPIVRNSLALGEIVSTQQTVEQGGIIGSVAPCTTVTNSFFNLSINSHLPASSEHGEGRPSEQLRQIETFLPEWDIRYSGDPIASIWRIAPDAVDFPYLGLSEN